MGKKIRIKAGTVEAQAELNNTKTAQAIWEALPITSRAKLWGNEIYFSIPVKLEVEEGQEVVSMGDLGYWPDGNGFCIFFGPTPVSQGDEIRAASPVTVFGKVIGDATVFKNIAARTKISVRRENNG
ncbi:MAG: cyclophilin-like fold protein [Dehalococcoidia bacterium]